MSSPRIDLTAVDLPALLSLLGGAVDAYVLQELGAAGLGGLRPGHGYVVQRLVDGPSTAAAITSDVDVSQQAVAKVVKELVQLGYVEQTVDRLDRRRRPLELTQRGRDAVAVSRRTRADVHARLVRSAGDADVEAARRVLLAAAELLGLRDRIAARTAPMPPAAS